MPSVPASRDQMMQSDCRAPLRHSRSSNGAPHLPRVPPCCIAYGAHIISVIVRPASLIGCFQTVKIKPCPYTLG